jgi:hypothetical protein
MTGGTYMYIHSYQIHNVLNVYRKQLSHGPGGNSTQSPRTTNTSDRIEISSDGQRQSIMDKISTEIVERITQAGPENQFEKLLADQLSDKSQQLSDVPSDVPSDFKYTVIDEHNRKVTNSLTIQNFSLNGDGTDLKAGKNIGSNTISEKASATTRKTGGLDFQPWAGKTKAR